MVKFLKEKNSQLSRYVKGFKNITRNEYGSARQSISDTPSTSTGISNDYPYSHDTNTDGNMHVIIEDTVETEGGKSLQQRQFVGF